MPVRRLRLVVLADDFDAAPAFIAEPVATPWNSLSARLEGEAGLRLTPFQEPGAP